MVHLAGGRRDRHHEIHHPLPGPDDLKYELFTKVSLRTDLPQYKLRHGDVATVVEHHPGGPGQEPGYSLEVCNAVGETLAVVTVRESQIEPLRQNEVLHVRRLEGAAA